jgi:hypothetical protein
METDLAALAASVAAVGSDLMFIAGPAAWAKIAVRMPLFKFPVVPSAALADTSVVCVSPSAVVVGGGLDAVRIDVSKEAVLHMEDSAPAAISASATPNTVAAPVRSMWSTDCLAIRIRADIDWALRSSSGIAVVNSISW